MNRVRNTWKRIVRMVGMSRQLQMGLILFALVLLVVIFAPAIAPFDPYYLGNDLLVGPGSTDICWEQPTWGRTCSAC